MNANVGDLIEFSYWDDDDEFVTRTGVVLDHLDTVERPSPGYHVKHVIDRRITVVMCEEIVAVHERPRIETLDDALAYLGVGGQSGS